MATSPSLCAWAPYAIGRALSAARNLEGHSLLSRAPIGARQEVVVLRPERVVHPPFLQVLEALVTVREVGVAQRLRESNDLGPVVGQRDRG